MLDLNIPNFVSVGLISILAWLGFNWAIAFVGWSV